MTRLEDKHPSKDLYFQHRLSFHFSHVPAEKPVVLLEMNKEQTIFNCITVIKCHIYLHIIIFYNILTVAN